MFKDTTKITIRSGKGGNGHVSFRREKYVPNGGPDGGDGGNGGSVIFQVDKGLTSLGSFNYMKKYSAQDGEEGGKRRCHGKSGKDLILKVPEGTIVKDAESGKIIIDMSKRDSYTILQGGKGGLGNMHFATSSMQTPKFAKPGEPSKELTVELELKVIADVGLVGFPNAGKSTFLSRISNAKPKIADYPFTTIVPNLGVVNLDNGMSYVVADIPGIIEGAAEGAGLGHDFLRHIERTGLLLHLVDVSLYEIEDPIQSIKAINHELKSFNEQLLNRPRIILANKCDSLTEEEIKLVLDKIKENFAEYQCFAISSVSGMGINELLYHIGDELIKNKHEYKIYENEYDPNEELKVEKLPYNIDVEEDGENKYFTISGPSVDKVLGYTNLDSEKGFHFFQNYIKTSGIQEELDALGVSDGDTVNVGGIEFEYMK